MYVADLQKNIQLSFETSSVPGHICTFSLNSSSAISDLKKCILEKISQCLYLKNHTNKAD
jgi:hypothetical protein